MACRVPFLKEDDGGGGRTRSCGDESWDLLCVEVMAAAVIGLIVSCKTRISDRDRGGCISPDPDSGRWNQSHNFCNARGRSSFLHITTCATSSRCTLVHVDNVTNRVSKLLDDDQSMHSAMLYTRKKNLPGYKRFNFKKFIPLVVARIKTL